jgi:hypothetical protein
MKLKIQLDDEETRALWGGRQESKAEVESWPTWKHNELPRALSDAAPDVIAEVSEDRC